MAQVCNKCGRPIHFVTMARSGKQNPLDVHPAENGNIAIGGDGLGYMVTGELKKPPLYTSHFSTCKKRNPQPKEKQHGKA